MPKQYFRVDGADMETGNETYLVLQAKTKPQAETLARQQGLLISSVRVAEPDDWSAAPAPDPVIDPEPAAPSPRATRTAPEPQLEPDHNTYTHPPEPDHAYTHPPEPDQAFTQQPDPFIDSSPVDEPPVREDAAPVHAPTAQAAPPQPAPTAAAVVLVCIATALVIGGVLALSLALWPDNGVRNELQQVDFRLHELSQTILGGMLVLSGLVVFVVATVCYMVPRRQS